ncbi:MAG TPA: hypothetical protein DIT40_08965, partial [Alphaproteobacteria bacterium]|nr:hypothetical protein [Alphaproteobacteria bacterium]
MRRLRNFDRLITRIERDPDLSEPERMAAVRDLGAVPEAVGPAILPATTVVARRIVDRTAQP